MKDAAEGGIAGAQALAGDFAGAQKTANLIQTASTKDEVERAISAMQVIFRGDFAGAQKTAELIQDAHSRDLAEAAIAIVQAITGDVAGAQKSADLTQDGNGKASVKETIAKITQLSAADLATAQKIMTQLRAGQIVGAQRTADLIQDVQTRSEAKEALGALASFKLDSAAGSSPGVRVSDWLSKFDDASAFAVGYGWEGETASYSLNADIFLNHSSDPKTKSAGGPQQLFDACFKTAAMFMEAQTVIKKMIIDMAPN